MAGQRVSKAPEERRAELVAAARRLFDENGVDKTRVSDIVKNVGVAQGVFYYYFHSKDAIVQAVVEEVTAQLEGDIHAIVKSTDMDFYRKLAGLLELYFGLLDQFTGDDAPALPDFTDSAATPVHRGRDLLMGYIRQLVSDGVQGGQVKARYPLLSVQVLEGGLLRAAAQELPTEEMVFALVEQALCLPQGVLTQGKANQ